METNINNTSTSNGKSKKRKYTLLGLGLLATSLFSFFGYQYWKKNKQTKTKDANSPDFKAENPNKQTSATKSTKTETSQAKTNSQTKKNTTPDSKKSTLKETAERIKKFKENFAKGMYDKKPDVIIAKGLLAAYLNKRFSEALTFLKHIENATQYSRVSKLFSLSVVGRGQKTLVGALLEVFKKDSERKMLYAEFKRIGLINNGHQWTFGNTVGDTPLLITTQETKVWKDPKTSVAVPLNMVLGREVCKRGNFTLFENHRQYYLVESNTVKTH